MTDNLERLRPALADRYTIERELGRGGMATVYLAQDLKHRRPVALKVLHPQISAVLGSQRFLREIDTAANLNHPHILPLFDSGVVTLTDPAGGSETRPYYAMPLVEGESLRDRLNRETQLPLADALQIAREVADALGYAHSRGIVHRDIKPENIMLAHGHALVADFGIARAMGAAGGEKLTETGLSLGTASYMSPEQALAEAVDGRTDIYALGCALYEMLAGEPPFTGPTAQAILARRLSMPVPSLGLIRDNLPANIERVILTALARAPVDRFATASAFAAALNTPSHSYTPTVAIDSSRSVLAPVRRRLTKRVAWVGGIVGLLGVLAVAAVRWWPASTPPLDQGLVAIVPFRVAGNDPALAYLREGMMTMMVTKLNGDAGPRAVDDRTVIRLWDRQREDREDVPDSEVLHLAGEMGASRVILGSVIGTPGRVVLSAQVLDVETGRTLQQATVDGLQDSLPWLADQLAVEVLALESGVDSRRLASLTSASVGAVKLYLDGRSAVRRGRWTAAIESFNEALEIDSGFALAAMNLANASAWTDGSEVDRGNELAWAARDRLSLRDRGLLAAQREGSIRAWENFVRRYPDIPEAWYALGDMYYHNGPLLGVTDAPERALAALRRGIALDPDTIGPPDAEPLMHLPDLALATGDTAGAVRLLSRLLANDSTGDYSYRLQLSLAQLSEDTGRVSHLRQGFARASWGNLFGIIFGGQQNVLEIPNAQLALDALRRMSEAPPEVVQMLGRHLALNRGRPQAAREAGYSPGRWGLRARIGDALYWGGRYRRRIHGGRESGPDRCGASSARYRPRTSCLLL